ncbi:MAG: benzoyl-CoA-dihydrodiol lyase [Rhodospirillaceae bacterium]|nr:benzoyl-CoA-dihydrodiol lyase [Rhodospirillaceae bacterium]MAX63119.1 benzoyl-CoA-dihydrodiol lyase [Rhodospirillaceae bacterium]MBB57966.1 benzoyl-CoA-dihydrodiol lyase [Rhodospirillaceae bacterium]|tara:strand:+ start:43485 stop:45143 length:1659 start_codon:yes stop_codon:yes gene_type:complete
MPYENLVIYDRDPESYKHWSLDVDGDIATLTLTVDEEGGIRPGYTLKLNSYDLGVDMELHDALQRVRFEHPTVKTVVVTSGLDRMFCAGANIYMLGQSTHGWKVNFCKFTNETRNSIEDSSKHSGLKFVAACNGVTAGGGYEMALACDEIFLIDDRSSAVSLPEVPLLGVLPGTGGLTRLTEKRKMRRDLADVFCTSTEGVRGQRAKEWNLVDHIAPKQSFMEQVNARAAELAKDSKRPSKAEGIKMTPVAREIRDDGYSYPNVDVTLDAEGRTVSLTVKAPSEDVPSDIDTILKQGMDWWPLAMARELDDAILMLRTNHEEVGLWLLKTQGDADKVLAADKAVLDNADNWFVTEVLGMMRRTFGRLDVTSRSMFAVIEEGSCFAGSLLELALCADRSYMLALPDQPDDEPKLILGEMNFGILEEVNGLSRLQTRFMAEPDIHDRLKKEIGKPFDAAAADEAGLVTFAPDDLDWDDELRIAIEERAALSPDALTGMEANLRFGGQENMATKVFGRLSAWQNWIFIRPNAVGEKGALKQFGSGTKAEFDWKRV